MVTRYQGFFAWLHVKISSNRINFYESPHNILDADPVLKFLSIGIWLHTVEFFAVVNVNANAVFPINLSAKLINQK